MQSASTAAATTSSNVDWRLPVWFLPPGTDQWWPAVRYPSHRELWKKFSLQDLFSCIYQGFRLTNTHLSESVEQQSVPVVRLLGTEPPIFWAVRDGVLVADFALHLARHVAPEISDEVRGQPLQEATAIFGKLLAEAMASTPQPAATNPSPSEGDNNNNNNHQGSSSSITLFALTLSAALLETTPQGATVKEEIEGQDKEQPILPRELLGGLSNLGNTSYLTSDRLSPWVERTEPPASFGRPENVRSLESMPEEAQPTFAENFEFDESLSLTAGGTPGDAATKTSVRGITLSTVPSIDSTSITKASADNIVANQKNSNKRKAAANQDGDESTKKRPKPSDNETQKVLPTASVFSALTEKQQVLTSASNTKLADTTTAPVARSSLPVNAAADKMTSKPTAAAAAPLNKTVSSTENVVATKGLSLMPNNSSVIPAAACAETSAAADVQVAKPTNAFSTAPTFEQDVEAPVSAPEDAARIDAGKAPTVQEAPTNSPSFIDTAWAMQSEAAVDHSTSEKQLPAKVTEVTATEDVSVRPAPKSTSIELTSEKNTSTGSAESEMSGATNNDDGTYDIMTPVTRAGRQRQKRQSRSGTKTTLGSSTRATKSRLSVSKAKNKQPPTARPTRKSVPSKCSTPLTASRSELIELEKPVFQETSSFPSADVLATSPSPSVWYVRPPLAQESNPDHGNPKLPYPMNGTMKFLLQLRLAEIETNRNQQGLSGSHG